MKLFAKTAGLKIKFIQVKHFNNIWLEPAKGNADVSIGGIGMMRRRLDDRVEWTIPYFHVMRTVVYNKKDPIKYFPKDVHKIVLGTYGSTGWLDAELRAKPLHKDHFMRKGGADKDDIKQLVRGNVQGLMRGSFVGQAIVHQHKKILAMAEPWEMDPSLLTSDGEVFAYPTRLRSGLAVGLSAFLIELYMNGHLQKLLKKYHLE